MWRSLLGDAAVALAEQEIPMGGECSLVETWVVDILLMAFMQGMNEHAIYEAVGTKRQRCADIPIPPNVHVFTSSQLQTYDVWTAKAVVPRNCRSRRVDVGTGTSRPAHDD
jgi:hypothetical protein